MPWWGWALLAWTSTGVVCALWWGLAIANAEVQELAQRIPEEESAGPEGHRLASRALGQSMGSRGGRR